MLALLGIALVTGCGTDRLVIKTYETPVFEPEVYQTCPTKKPTIPPSGSTWAVWWNYITDLDTWGTGCESSVIGGREWQEKERAKMQTPQPQAPEKSSGVDLWPF